MAISMRLSMSQTSPASIFSWSAVISSMSSSVYSSAISMAMALKRLTHCFSSHQASTFSRTFRLSSRWGSCSR